MAEAVFTHTVRTASPPLSAHFATLDSAGTGAYHARSPPDSRTLAVLAKHGIPVRNGRSRGGGGDGSQQGYTHAARRVKGEDFRNFDYVFAMDLENLEDLQDMRRQMGKRDGEGGLARVELWGRYGAFAPGADRPLKNGAASGLRGGRRRNKADGDGDDEQGEEVVDPYYGGGEGFEIAFEQMTRFTRGFLHQVLGTDGGDLAR